VPGGEQARCDFCGRRSEAAPRVVQARRARICADCLELAAGAIREAPSSRRRLRIRPRPPRPADLDDAEQEVQKAYETCYCSEYPDAARLAVLEGGEELAATMAAAREARRALRGTTDMDVSVEDVRFLDEDEAEVLFVLLFPAVVLPRMPERGRAVLVDGRWKVARDTWCRLVQSLGVPCA
jgi:ClpX C4-type zinc finger